MSIFTRKRLIDCTPQPQLPAPLVIGDILVENADLDKLDPWESHTIYYYHIMDIQAGWVRYGKFFHKTDKHYVEIEVKRLSEFQRKHTRISHNDEIYDRINWYESMWAIRESITRSKVCQYCGSPKTEQSNCAACGAPS